VSNSTPSSSRPLAPFLMIWGAQLFSLIGSTIAQFALVWWLTQTTDSATVLATASLVAMLPGIFVGPLAGAFVDRWNRRWVMIVADSLSALIALGLAALFWTGALQVWHIYLAMLVRSLAGSFHWPAMQSSTSLMVPPKHLTRVAGLNHTTFGIMNVFGPPLGALLLGILPLHGVMLIDVATAVIAVSPLFFIRIPQPTVVASPTSGTPTVWADLLAGLRYVRAWPGLLLLLGMAMLINFVLTPAGSLTPLLVTRHFHGAALQLGWLNSAWGIGVVVGGLILSAWGGFRRRSITSLTGLALMGVGFVIVGVAPANALWLAIVGNLIAGLMNPITNAPLLAMLQAVVEPQMQGRVFTLIGSFSGAMSPLSLAIAGPLADVIGVRAWYVAGGLLCTAIGIGAFFIPAIVRLEENHRHVASTAESTPVDHHSPLATATLAAVE
jgi:DHA3 family macrolide efflux protein-like MFS transporter